PEAALLGDYLRDEQAQDPGARLAAARVLSMLPAGMISAEALLDAAATELRRDTRSREVVAELLGGVGAAGRQAPPEAQDRLVHRIVDSEAFQSAVGRDRLIYAAGGIGGEAATDLVMGYLARNPMPSQQRWAVETLGAMGTPRAIEAALRYAKDGQAPGAIR